MLGLKKNLSKRDYLDELTQLSIKSYSPF